MNKFDRISAILIHLQSKRLVTAQELSDRFEVSLRTIYRDVESLNNAGVPILGEIGVGYSMMEGYRLPPIMFSQEEAISFLMAEKIIDKYADSQSVKYFNTALFKIKSVLRSTEKKTVEDIENRISIVKNSVQNSVVDKILPIIIRSVTEKEVIKILYTVIDPNDTKIEIIEPIGIYNENGIWSTIAYNTENQMYRNYRIDRIAQVKLTNKTFSVKHISLNEYLQSQKKSETIYEPKILIKKEVAQYIEEQKYKYGFIRELEKGDKIEMIFETTCLQTFSRWFLTIADSGKIIEPKELKSIFKGIVTEISRNV